MGIDVNVDFLEAETWDETMRERMRWLRENDPVHWSERSRLWVVSRFEDVNYVSKNHQLFYAGEGVRPGNPVRLPLIDEDEPRHTQLRRLINRGFTPRMVRKLETAFRQIATETIAEFIGGHREGDWPYGREEGAPEAADLLRNAALLANRRITERIEAEPWLARMGTTMVSALVEADGRCHLANVGDSRGYLWREGNLRQLTSDHSWVNEQVRRGGMTQEEATSSSFRNVITRSLGNSPSVDVDIFCENLEIGDTFVLCSDGLSGEVTDDEIHAAVADNAPSQAAWRLVDLALDHGGRDNVTIVVVSIRDIVKKGKRKGLAGLLARD